MYVLLSLHINIISPTVLPLENLNLRGGFSNKVDLLAGVCAAFSHALRQTREKSIKYLNMIEKS